MTEINAPIASRGEGRICFRVDDVELSGERLQTSQVAELLKARTGSVPMALSHDEAFAVVTQTASHPLVGAVHLAFSRHLPLVLTPDAVWMTIAQGFVHHVNVHAEELRSQLVGHAGRVELKVETRELSQPEDWASAVEEWTWAMRDYVREGLYRLMVCEFSTTTDVARTASQITMMDAFQRYFDFGLRCVCGIPSITVAGTVDDWREIRRRVNALAGYGLEWWTSRLLPVCDSFVATAEGRPPLAFWRDIYKPKTIYGDDLIAGWIADLFPYLNHWLTKRPTVRNPILAIPRERLRADDGVSSGSFPDGLSSAPFTLTFEGEARREGPCDEKLHMELVGGFVGVHQDAETSAVEPEIGWFVRRGSGFGEILDRIEQEHETRPSAGWGDQMYVRDLPKEIVQMVERFDGAELFGGTDHHWRVRPAAEWEHRGIVGTDHNLQRFVDLADGRCCAFGFVSRKVKNRDDPDSEVWVVCGRPVTYEDPDFGEEEDGLEAASAVLVAKGIDSFFGRVLASDGRYYFDEPDFLPEGVATDD